LFMLISGTGCIINMIGNVVVPKVSGSAAFTVARL
jgi:hypothetical protein